jgi:hypothetical protein
MRRNREFQATYGTASKGDSLLYLSLQLVDRSALIMTAQLPEG